MLDVHPPHHSSGTWREILTHLAIVTIGLFIALSLEGVVEYMHHRHLVHEAHQNIRQELADNHQAVQQDLTYIQQAIDAQRSNIATIHAFGTPDTAHHYHLNYGISFNQPDDAAWNSARDTGALTFMPYKQVQEYAGVYATQTLVNSHMVEILRREETALAPVYMYEDFTRSLPPDEKQTMLRNSAEILVQLTSLRDIIQQLDKQYTTELNKKL